MKDMHHLVATYLRARFDDTERGASLVEYALLIALIAIVCFAAVTFFGGATSNEFKEVGASLAN